MEELVELGFEGVNKVVDKYHDPIYDKCPPAPWTKKKQKQQQQQQGQHHSGHRDHHERQRQRQDSPPQQQEQQPSRHGQSEAGDDHAGGFEFNGYSRRMYSPERPGSWGDGGASNVGYPSQPRGGDRGYYAAPVAVSAVARRQDYGQYQVAARASSPPPNFRPQYAQVGAYGSPGRDRPSPRRRPSSYSPPRRESRQRSPPRRARSKSPNHHRAIATIVGALAGGFLGNAAKKGDTLSTVAGAVVGGLGGRELEKVYDRHEHKNKEEEIRRERRRDERRRQDDYY